MVTPDNYDGMSMMSIRVIPEVFGSDPDVYISTVFSFNENFLDSELPKYYYKQSVLLH